MHSLDDHGLDKEWAKLWMRGDTLHLHARYLTHAFTPHTHEGYVLAVIEGGVEAFRYRGGTHNAPLGHVILINPGEVHTGSAATERGWVYRTLYPSVAKLQGAAEAVCQTRLVAPSFPQAVVHDPELAALVRRYHLRSERGSGLALEEAFVELTALLLARYTGVPSTPHEPGREPRAVRLTRDYLEANLQAGPTLAELGTLTGLSPYALLRAFRRSTGLTPHEYGIVRRIEVAKKQLALGEKVAAVAADLGFYDQSHFGRHFRRVVGVTPGVYAKGAILS